jgi:hypothetical protein
MPAWTHHKRRTTTSNVRISGKLKQKAYDKKSYDKKNKKKKKFACNKIENKEKQQWKIQRCDGISIDTNYGH